MWVQEIEYLEKGKTKVYLSSGEIWMLYRSEIRQFDLQEETELADEVYDRIREEVLLKRVKKRAMYLLEKMDRTEQGLRKKLSEQEYPPDLIDAAIAYVKSFHYVDDYRYACTYINYRQDRMSRYQLKVKLYGKGVPGELIDRALEECYEGDEQDQIIRLLEKKKFDAQNSDPKEFTRVYQYLMRRGFRSNDVLRAMKSKQ